MFILALGRYDRYVSHFFHAFVGFRLFIVFLNGILSKNIILNIMDLKISDTNRRKTRGPMVL